MKMDPRLNKVDSSQFSYDEHRSLDVLETADCQTRLLDYDDALELAKECWEEIDYFRETENAFIFSKQDDLSIGGCGPVVVLKLGGDCLNMPAYLSEGLGTSP